MRLLACVGAVVILGGCGSGDSGLPSTTALSPDGARHSMQSFSPDGKRVAYWTPVAEGSQLWVANADMSAPVKLSASGPFVGPAIWSPDGSRLVAVSGQFGLADVVVVPATGGEAQRVTMDPGIEFPMAWYPDGDRIAYTATAAGGTFSSFVVSVQSGVSKPLVPGEKRPNSGYPSPDGSHVGYITGEGSTTTIWVADSAGGNPRQLTTEGFETFFSGTPWSPDGKEILYESRRTGTADLWVVPIAGGAARQLTRDVRNDRFGVWSPDGKWVAFRSDRGRQTDVWVVPAAGGEERRITDNTDEEQGPLSWRPGTNELTFSTITQAAGVWALDLASSAERKLTPDSVRTSWFSVSPDGEQVNYVIERGGGVQDIAVMPLAGGPSRTLVSGGGAGVVGDAVVARRLEDRVFVQRRRYSGYLGGGRRRRCATPADQLVGV
ncbi:MAG: DPP IV N-terminal domain-containing protein [Gemmatimonadetes bacterium]|nr:DPP IV N-terminal domain-containing protein [Gemmatimonadota bacterium]